MNEALTLPGVEAAAEWTTRRLGEGAGQLALTGRPSAGKSATLERVSEMLAARGGVRSILVAPPAANDAAPVAMVTVASGLTDVDQGLVDFVRDIEHPWSAKLERVSRALESASADDEKMTVLLIDEPWLQQDPLPTIFSDRAQGLTSTLTNLPRVRTVIAAQWIPPFLRAEQREVQAASVPDEVLAPERWNGLGDAAVRLSKLDRQLLSKFSPLELRLAVALVATGQPPEKALAPGVYHRALVQRLFDSPALAKVLRRVVGRLAVCRTRFRQPMLERAGWAELDEASRAVLTNALLTNKGGWWRLHGALAREAREREWLTLAELDDAHARAADYHRGEFAEAATSVSVGRSILHDMEVMHHLTEAGDVAGVEALKPYFVEQWDALGRSLSRPPRRRYPEAVRAYERALEHDLEDSYAHHYLAFNLDIQGREPQRVEAEYGEALKREKTHPWYHARRVCFFITRGRMGDARVAWAEALERMFPEGTDEGIRLYEEAHRQVARLLLHRGQLELAREALDDIPPRHRAPWITALRALLTTLGEAEANQLVFPSHIPLEERWNGPHLLHHPDDRERVKAWTPGRVASADEDVLRLRIAQRDEDGDVTYGWLDLPHDEVKRLSQYGASLRIPAGTFVELVTLRKPTKELLLLHRLPPPDPALPALFMEPDRYLRPPRA